MEDGGEKRKDWRVGTDMYKRYFILSEQEGNPLPQIMSWYGKLDVRKLNRLDYGEIPKHLRVEVRTGMDVFYPDIMTNPVLMVSEEVMEIMKIYDSRMPFVFLALFDTQKGESKTYYCPVLAEDNAGQEEAIYRVKIENGYEIRICEELTESLLSRGATGLELHREKSAI